MAHRASAQFILVKVNDPAQQEEVLRRIDAELPGNYVWLTREMVTGFERSIPGLDGFVKAVLALSAIVSTLVILLAMYTTITERTREIAFSSLSARRSASSSESSSRRRWPSV